MKRARRTTSRKASSPKPAVRLSPAEAAIEEIRDRRKKLWKELGSYEAVAAAGRRARAERLAAKRSRERPA